MKRIVLCCDGTWQELASAYPTNVVKTVQSIVPVDAKGISQMVFYDPGVGTDESFYDKITGGAFGRGLDENIYQAYRFLCLNYVPGDEIYVFGFSRGAYTARSLVGMINRAGILKRPYIRLIVQAYRLYKDRELSPDSTIVEDFRKSEASQIARISALCCWDTVGSLGVPDLIPWLSIDNHLNERYRFHNTHLSPIVEHAFHAIAIDEKRSVFDVTHMEKGKGFSGKLIENWFPGDHGCVGGGAKCTSGFSDAALEWMHQCIREKAGLGLELDFTKVPLGVSPALDGYDDFNIADIAIDLKYRLLGVKERDLSGGVKSLHRSVKELWKSNPKYRPVQLKKRYRKHLD